MGDKFTLYSTDHPRVCGEHKMWFVTMILIVGSPPRVRGTRHIQTQTRAKGGITPACAGNTHTSSFASADKKDHPRVCGEHTTGKHTREYRQGSPPACAGNTQRPRTSTCSFGDHPRVCGKHPRASQRRPPARGSPPRVRGTHRAGVGREP